MPRDGLLVRNYRVPANFVNQVTDDGDKSMFQLNVTSSGPGFGKVGVSELDNEFNPPCSSKYSDGHVKPSSRLSA